jgi:exopolysaccharide biosynthesis polyprenyl glycosylphosphotransferase
MISSRSPIPLFARRLVQLAMAAVDVLIVFDAFSLAYLLRFRLHLFASRWLEPAPVDAYLKAMAVVAYIWVLLSWGFGLYDLRRYRSAIDVCREVARAVSFGTLIVLSLTYFYRDFSFSRLVCVYAWVIALGLLAVFRIALLRFRAFWHRSGHDLRRVILIGSRSLARGLAAKVRSQPELGYDIVGLVDNQAPDLEVEGCPYLGRLEDLERIISAPGAERTKGEVVEGLLVALPTLGQLELLELIQLCERRGLSVRMVPATYDLQVNYRDLEEVDGVPLVKICEQEARRVDDLLKRGLDLALASALLLLTLPLWGLIALAIRLSDGGPVFFLQARIGRNGRPFRMWKFRTMQVDAEQKLAGLVRVEGLPEPVFKLEDDPRVTRVGRLLRRTSLDELPQLLNVLGGSMSLVGPRPEEERLVRLYNVWERRRLKALPGMTGLQQVICRGCPSLRERVRWDIVYLRKRSLLLDLWILARTFWVVLRGQGAR